MSAAMLRGRFDLAREAAKVKKLHLSAELPANARIAVRKQQGPAGENACKPLILLVPEAGVEPARPYERGILSPYSYRPAMFASVFRSSEYPCKSRLSAYPLCVSVRFCSPVSSV